MVDNKPHLTNSGVSFLAGKAKDLIIATTRADHPANALKGELSNVHLLKYDGVVDLSDLFVRLRRDFGAKRVTVQSGGTINTALVREGLIDRVLFVVAPALIGGRDTSTPMDGESLHVLGDLSNIKPLQLVQAVPLEDSYVLLEYDVRNT